MLQYEKKTHDLKVSKMMSFDFFAHVHRHIELIVCTDGVIGVSCRNRDAVLQPGDMMIAFSHDIHAYRDVGQGEGVMIIVRPDFLGPLAARLEGKRRENFLIGRGEALAGYARAMLEEFQGEGSREVLLGWLYLLLGNALKHLPFADEQNAGQNETFALVLEYNSEHYTEPLSLKSLALKFGLDSCTLSRMFTAKISCGYLKYLHELRVEHAKNLLCSTDLSIAEVYSQSGFSDQRSFYRVFREYTRMTPSRYRSQQAQ